MRKRTMLMISVCVVVLIVIGGVVYLPPRTTPTPHYWAKAKATKASVACLAANPKIAITKTIRNTIEMNALLYLYDVPAGTNVNVKLATYLPTKVTGTDYYPTKYGSYNFAMTKESDGWNITDFTHCD